MDSAKYKCYHYHEIADEYSATFYESWRHEDGFTVECVFTYLKNGRRSAKISLSKDCPYEIWEVLEQLNKI